MQAFCWIIFTSRNQRMRAEARLNQYLIWRVLDVIIALNLTRVTIIWFRENHLMTVFDSAFDPLVYVQSV